MNRTSGKSGDLIEADIIVLDGDDHPVLLVETKARAAASQEHVDRFLGRFVGFRFPFGMFADLATIRIFGQDLAEPRSPILELKTSDVLSLYEPAFDQKRISPTISRR